MRNFSRELETIKRFKLKSYNGKIKTNKIEILTDGHNIIFG